MAYDFKGYNRGPRMGTVGTVTYYKHFYVTGDNAATVVAAAYFNDLAVRGLVKVGESIEVMTVVGGTPAWRMYNITAVTATAVTVTAVTGAGLT